jgi:hypothetical protein
MDMSVVASIQWLTQLHCAEWHVRKRSMCIKRRLTAEHVHETPEHTASCP